MIQQQQRCPVKRHMAPAVFRRASAGVCASALQLSRQLCTKKISMNYPLSPGLPIFPSYVISLKGLWWDTFLCVHCRSKQEKTPDEMLLCVCFCLVLEDHIASEDSVALGNNICLVSVGQVPSEQKCHLTRHEGFESMSAQCGALHHSNESLKELMVMAFFSACWCALLMAGVTRNTVFWFCFYVRPLPTVWLF